MEGGSFGNLSQVSPLLSSNRKQLKSEKSSLSGSYESPKSYGSTTKPVRSEVDIKMVGHVVEGNDTLQGLSIRYDVPVEEIKRVNKLWTNDNIQFYKIIKIPIKALLNSSFVELEELDMDVEQEKHDLSESDNSKNIQPLTNTNATTQQEHSVLSFLGRLDETIKDNVKQSEKLRLHSGKNLLEKLERDQHTSNVRSDNLFRPLSFQSASQRVSGVFVTRSTSDMMNADEQFFEL